MASRILLHRFRDFSRVSANVMARRELCAIGIVEGGAHSLRVTSMSNRRRGSFVRHLHVGKTVHCTSMGNVAGNERARVPSLSSSAERACCRYARRSDRNCARSFSSESPQPTSREKGGADLPEQVSNTINACLSFIVYFISFSHRVMYVYTYPYLHTYKNFMVTAGSADPCAHQHDGIDR